MTSKLQSAELDELVNTQCEGVLTDQQAARIEELSPAMPNCVVITSFTFRFMPWRNGVGKS